MTFRQSDRIEGRFRIADDIPAIVIGLDLNGLGVVRALGSAGVDVIGMDDSISHAGRASRYCRDVIAVDPCSPSALIDALQDLGGRLERPAILFPTMDDTVRILSQMRGQLPGSLRLLLPEASMVSRLMEKADLAELAREHGWPVPATAVCRDASEILAVSRDFPCPGVMKPGRRDLESLRGIPQKLWTFRTPEEILAAYKTLSRWETTVILQEMVPGPDSAVLFCLFYVDKTSTPQALFVGRKIRQFPPLFGSTSSAEPIEDDRVRAFAYRFIRDVSFQGLGSVEMKVDGKSGALFFIEPTVGRTDYQSFLAVANGVNIPGVAYRDLAELPWVPQRRTGRPVKYVVALRDLRSGWRQVREGRLSSAGYLASLKGPKVFALLHPRDPGPWFYRVHYFTTGRGFRICKRMALRVWRALLHAVRSGPRLEGPERPGK